MKLTFVIHEKGYPKYDRYCGHFVFCCVLRNVYEIAIV